MTATLELSDGTTTLNLLGATYGLANENWQPQVAELATHWIGGAPPYHDVTEKIPLMVRAASASAMATALTDLARLIDQANRRAAGDDVAAVYLNIKTYSTATTWRAMVLGGDSGAVMRLVGRVGYLVDAGGHYQGEAKQLATPVELVVRRRGLWVATSATQYNDGNYNSVANIKSVLTWSGMTAGAAGVRHLIDVKMLTWDCAAAYNSKSRGYLFLVSNSGMLHRAFESNGLSYDVGWALSSHATALNNNVFRCTPSVTTERLLKFTWPTNKARRYHVFIKYKNFSSSINWTIKLYQQVVTIPPSNPFGDIELSRIYVPSGDTEIKIGYFGSINFNADYTTTSGIGVTPSATGTGADVLDVESIVLVADESDTAIINLERFGLHGDGTGNYEQINLYHNQLGGGHGHHPYWTYIPVAPNDGAPPIVNGNLLIALRGEAPNGLLYATGNGATNWNTGDGGGAGSTSKLGIQLHRRRGVLVP